MSKNNMKLIMEGWRQSIDEMNAAANGGVQGHAAVEEELNEEELDEGMKEIAFGTILALMGIGDAAAGTISDPVSGKEYSTQVVKGASQAATGAAANNPDNKALQVLAKGLQAAAKNPGDTTMGAIPDLNMDVASDVIDYAKHVLDGTEAKLKPKKNTEPAADSGIEGDTNNDGKLSPLELQRLQQSKSNLTQKQKDDAKAGMKKIQQQKTNESAI